MVGGKAIHDVTYELSRSLGLTRVLGHPGASEQKFSQKFPGDSLCALACVSTAEDKAPR